MTLTPCILSHACDGVIRAYEAVGSIRFLACSSLVSKVWVPCGICQKGTKEKQEMREAGFNKGMRLLR